jgi:hypothetical protein
MAKNELDLDLDKELNDSLDFLDDKEFDNKSSSSYVSAKQSSTFNKTKLIYIISTITVLGIGLLLYINTQPKGQTMLTTLPDKPVEPIAIKAPASTPEVSQTSLPVTAPLAEPEPSTVAINPPPETIITKPTENNSANNNLTWQDLKKTTESPTTILASPTVNGFEHTTPAIVEQLSNNNIKTQESINELKTTVEKINTDITTNFNQIKELQNNLKEISKTINNVDSKILNLTTTVDSLSFNVKKYTQDEDLDLTVSVKPSEPDLFSNTPEYLVHAIIPGRAWLKSSSGQIITVTEGDLLGDFGKVALIDTANNLVRTSSGVVFR